MELPVEAGVFERMLRSKERKLEYTAHSIRRARKRAIIAEHENTIPRFEDDLNNSAPYKVVEQPSENPGERKFKIYYRSQSGFMVYVIVLDGQIRLLSVYRTSKKIQKMLYRKSPPSLKKRHK